MKQLAQQFNLIHKIKSLVKKTSSSFFKKHNDFGISEAIAKKIQVSAYDLSHAKNKHEITPPYLDIAEQLHVEDDQIFRAAVYNLTNIALNEARYAQPILEALENATKQTYRTKEQLDYLKIKINTITKALRS